MHLWMYLLWHSQAKTRDLFEQWVTQLRHHRMFRQNEIAMEPPERQLQSDSTSNRRVFTLLIQSSITSVVKKSAFRLEIDRYIGLPIFPPDI